MAKQYTTHTKSVEIVMPYIYVCPFCHGRVEVRRPFKVETTYTHRGIAKSRDSFT